MAACRGKRLSTEGRPKAPVLRMVAAYVSHNALPPDRLGALIAEMHAAIGKLAAPLKRGKVAPVVESTPHAAANEGRILSSITPAGLKSFEDGKVYRMLRRHLRSKGLDPVTYRSKWELPPDYPMTCPAYSEKRSTIAWAIRLGHVSRS